MVERTTRRDTLCGIAGTGLGLTVLSASAVADGSERYVVVARSDSAVADVDGKGFEITAEVAGGDVLIVEGAADARETLEELETVDGATPDVELEPPRLEPADASVDSDDFPDDWDWDRRLVQQYEAHEYATGEGTRLGFLDSGIGTHPDLSNLNVEDSRAFIEGEMHPYDGPDRMHGSFCAGFAAGTGDWRLTGVAPETDLVSLRRGSFVSNWVMALDYAAEIDCDAVNMSFGTGPWAPEQNAEGAVGWARTAMQLAARDAARRGVVVVTSQGNDATNLQQGGQFRLWTRAQSAAIGVNATDENDELASFSNYGTNETPVAAPGVNCLGPINYEDCDEVGVCDRDPPWGIFSGTSISAPYVSGLALLVRELRPDYNPRQVLDAIKKGAEGANGKSDPELGAGRINVLNTVEHVRERASGRRRPAD